MKSWQQVQADFPINKQRIWLNNSGITPACLAAQERVNLFMHEFGEHCIFSEEFNYEATRSNIKNRLANLLQCKPENLAIIHHTAEGMNFFAHGLGLRSGDRVLLLENEYPSNVYPWTKLQEQGVQVDFIPVGVSPEQFLENLEKVLVENDAEVTVASLSGVHWLTGMPLPMEEMAGLCHQHNVQLVLDAAQVAGHVDLLPERWGISMMAFSAWKWLLGPLGLGVLYVDQNQLDRLDPVFMGSASVVDDENYLPYRQVLKPDAERYNYSTASFVDWVYFEATLDYLAELGHERVQARLYELADYLAHALRERGFVCDGQADVWQSGIVVAQKRGVDSAPLVAGLQEQGITTSLRAGKIRLSPHIYISEQQLDETARKLALLAD